MPRPKKNRNICINPAAYYFKPRGIPVDMLEETDLSWDELEALKLADFLDLYQDEAAERMKISRTTFSRIIKSARKKIADGILNGKAIRIPQAVPEHIKLNLNVCSRCGKKIRNETCPRCNL